MDNAKKHYTCRWCGGIIEADTMPARCGCGKSSFNVSQAPAAAKPAKRDGKSGYTYGAIHERGGLRMYAGYDR